MADPQNPDTANPSPRPAPKPPIPEPTGDGFPREEDVSTPPPGSDPREGQHKKPD